MAKNDNLHDFLVDVADAIREKKGTTELINPQNFSEEILSIEGGGGTEYTFGANMTDNTGDGKLALQSLIIKEGVTSIAKDAYNGYINLTTVHLPASVEIVGERAFRECSSLSSINLQNVRDLNTGAFYATALTSVVISENVEVIGNEVFQNCSQLSSVVMPNVKRLLPYVFKNCTSLAEVDIPASIIEISIQAFYGCTSLETVIIRATNPPGIQSSTFQNNSATRLIYVPDESIEAYKAATNWSSYADSIKGISELPA